MPEKRCEVIDGFTVKFHANGITRCSKGRIVEGKPKGYWEWYRIDGTRKRSGHFKNGVPTGEWTTYDQNGDLYKVTNKKYKTTNDIN